MTPDEKDDQLKSAVELAMERLREKDRASQTDAPRTLTGEQKQAIAEVRRRYEARIAETGILQADGLAKARERGDLEKLATLDEEHRREIASLEEKRDAEIQRIREE
jgi:hypothetical protein